LTDTALACSDWKRERACIRQRPLRADRRPLGEWGGAAVINRQLSPSHQVGETRQDAFVVHLWPQIGCRRPLERYQQLSLANSAANNPAPPRPAIRSIALAAGTRGIQIYESRSPSPQRRETGSPEFLAAHPEGTSSSRRASRRSSVVLDIFFRACTFYPGPVRCVRVFVIWSPFEDWPVFPSLRRNPNDLPALGRNIRQRQKTLLESVQSPCHRPIHWRASRRLCMIWASDRPLKSSCGSSTYSRPSASARRLRRSRSNATKGESAAGRGISLSSIRPSRL
jgi:hypothetical protein